MKYTLLRNAAAKLVYAGAAFLLDPAFTEKGQGPSYAGERNSPLKELPCSVREAVSGTDAVVISHIHSDHFDEAASAALDKALPVFCQPADTANPLLAPFRDVRPLGGKGQLGGVRLRSVPAKHGTSPAVLADMGASSGIIFTAEGEPTVYWAGDSVWYEGVRHTIETFSPEVVIVHAGSAMWMGEPITMDAAGVLSVCRAAPAAKVIAIHMESCDHCRVSRAALRAAADAAGISRAQLLIPADGEEIMI